MIPPPGPRAAARPGSGSGGAGRPPITAGRAEERLADPERPASCRHGAVRRREVARESREFGAADAPFAVLTAKGLQHFSSLATNVIYLQCAFRHLLAGCVHHRHGLGELNLCLGEL